jgi:hypothetical protein
MKYLIATDERGGEAWLTNESSASRYGAPVLEVTADDVDGIFGPADILHEQDGRILLAAHVVAGWLAYEKRTSEECEFGMRFLAQFPVNLTDITTFNQWAAPWRIKTAKPSGKTEAAQFACPKWDKVTQQLTFPGTPEEQHKECARMWRRNIKVLLEGNARGLTNARRKELAQLDRQLEAFLG